QQSVASTQLTDESWSAFCPEAGMAALAQDDPFQWKASDRSVLPEVGFSVEPTDQQSLAATQLTEKSRPPTDGVVVATDQLTPFHCSIRTVGSFPATRVCSAPTPQQSDEV